MTGDSVTVYRPLHLPSRFGDLPVGWLWMRLDDACDGVFDCPHSTPRLVDTGPYVVRSQDIITGVFRTEKAARVSEETYKERTSRVVPARGDLLYSREGTYFGIAAEVPDRTRVCLGQRMVLIRPKSSVVDFKFLYYWMNSQIMASHIHGYRDGTVAERLNLPTIRALPVLVPPLPEQRTIARILGMLDDKIELNRRMSETLEAMAQALFKSWFVDFDPVRAKAEGRDPGFPRTLADLFPTRLVDSELGEIPKGWTIGTIGDLASRIMEKIEDPTDWQEESLIDLSRMPQKSIALNEWGLGAELTTSVTQFRAKDTLFGAIRPYFHKVGIAPINGVTNVSVFVLRAKQEADWPFIAMLSSMTDTVNYATRVAKGTKMPVVSWPDFQNYSFPFAPAHIRAAFCRISEPMLDRITSNIKESHALAATRDTLLPKLISGELRMTDTDEFIGVSGLHSMRGD
ncbi:restriction endonuclease subunit S [Candidatus Poribacteria bacterium]|nr:restriction endonuclease subunit S [Candidatus Poribacteria bacterium]